MEITTETTPTIQEKYFRYLYGLSYSDAITFVGIGNATLNKQPPQTFENGQVLYVENEIGQSDVNIEELVRQISCGLDYFVGDCAASMCPQSLPENRRSDIFTDTDISMQYLSFGSESIIFLLKLWEEKYVVKTNQNINPNPRGFHQYPRIKNYVCEMIARRTLSKKRRYLLDQNNISINPILMASEHFSLEKYIEGTQASEGDIPDNTFKESIRTFLRTMEDMHKDWVWKNLEPDTNKEGFIITKDNFKIWVDPFVRY